jgi:hypothetical protein
MARKIGQISYYVWKGVKKQMKTYYPLASQYSFFPHSLSKKGFKGKLTGEFRPPKKGEWYLSGAIKECYLAPNDLLSPFNIIELVKVETITIEREVG